MTPQLRAPATSARKLGSGGEADVYEVPDRPRLAFKCYRQPTSERTAKLRVMLAHPPEVDGGKAAIAWPVELVSGAGGQAAGFLMPRIDLATNLPLFRVYNPHSRQRVAPGFTWRYLLRTARNVAALVDAVHRGGYVIGDLNESNLLVSNRALVSLVDCDSMQVRDPDTGAVHRCRVGKPEFTAPELHKLDLDAQDRTQASDAFALAVLVFQLLLEGVHPFGGIWCGRGDPPDIAARIRRGRFPYRRTTRVLAPPPMGLPLRVLPPRVRRLAWRTFTSGMRRPSRRPSPAEWQSALEEAEAHIVQCSRSPHHEYGDHLRCCPWCARIDMGLPDPFPGPTGRSNLSKTPPSRIQLVARAARARLQAASTASVSAVRTAMRVARRVQPPGIRRVPAFVTVDLPSLVLLAAGCSMLRISEFALGAFFVLTLAHAAAQARRRTSSRARAVLVGARLLRKNAVASARAVVIATSSTALGVSAALVAVAAYSGQFLTASAFVEQMEESERWVTAAAAVAVTRWPHARHPEWRPETARLFERLRARLLGRSIPVLWAASIVAAALALSR